MLYEVITISLKTIEKEFADYIQVKESITYNKENKKFDIRQTSYFYELELYSKPVAIDDKHDFSKLFLDLIRSEGLEFLSWSKKVKDLKDRVNFINQNIDIELPDFSDDVLLNTLEEWLSPYLSNIKTIKELESLDIYSILLGTIPWDMQQQIDILAPTHIKVPSGSNIKIDYSNSRNNFV